MARNPLDLQEIRAIEIVDQNTDLEEAAMGRDAGLLLLSLLSLCSREGARAAPTLRP